MATSIPLPVINMAEQLPLPSGSSDQIIIAQPTVTQAASMQFELSDTDDNNQWPPEAPVQAVTSAGMTTMMEVNDLESFEQPTFVQELQVSIVCPQILDSLVQHIYIEVSFPERWNCSNVFKFWYVFSLWHYCDGWDILLIFHQTGVCDIA